MYVNSDEPNFENNNCEKIALQKISNSNSNVVELNEDCIVLEWGKIIKPESSELNAQLLCKWRITNRKILFYNK